MTNIGCFSVHSFFCAFMSSLTWHAASVAQLNVHPTGATQLLCQHSLVDIDREIFSTAILCLPLIQEGQWSVSGERMCTILVTADHAGHDSIGLTGPWNLNTTSQNMIWLTWVVISGSPSQDPGLESRWRQNSAHDCMAFLCTEPLIIILPLSWYDLTLKAPRKPGSENVVCLCRLLNILANFSNLFLHTGKQCGPRSDCS